MFAESTSDGAGITVLVEGYLGGGVKVINTVGDKWATFQTINFQNNSQPFYVLLDDNMNLLNEPVGYTPNETEYKNWLQQGIEKMKDLE